MTILGLIQCFHKYADAPQATDLNAILLLYGVDCEKTRWESACEATNIDNGSAPC